MSSIIQKMSTLYEIDYNQWVGETVKLLQEENYAAVDWTNLIEEVADLSRRERDKLESLLTVLFEHLLKIAYWEAERNDNLRGWMGEIQNFRTQIKRLLKKSPSLQPYLVEVYEECYQDARKIMIRRTGLNPEIFPISPMAPLEKVLDEDWLPL
jgi:hypothetical protein